MYNQYRGIERALLATDFFTKKSKRYYNQLLKEYFDSIMVSLEEPSKAGLMKLFKFCNLLEKFDVFCEIIAYDSSPLTGVFGYSVELLGIDVIYDDAESLICDGVNKELKHFLNTNGLCRTSEDAENIVQYLDHCNLEWKPCYVYKVLQGDG